MRALILGAAGMLGRKLAKRFERDGWDGAPLTDLKLVDVLRLEPEEGSQFSVSSAVADLSDPGVADELVSERPDVIFHLAAVVSGEAELDLEKGYRVNLDGTRALFDAIRRSGPGYRPRVVFASSIAVFGAPFPEAIGDDFATTPLTSYGTQKAMSELLLSDYSRR
ncbi:MAG: NAD-dependent epimerase/dehydratase family protein, partial [Gaiellaceae bacterium]